MFNIYYINYAKAYEIAMLLDNKIIEEITKEHNTEGGLTGTAETGTGGMTEISLVGKYLPKLSLNGELTGSKSSKVIDTVKVITTKSTILDVIYKKSKEVSKLGDRRATNIMIDEKGDIKVIDFGFGKKLIEEQQENQASVLLNWPASKVPDEIYSEQYGIQTEIFYVGYLIKNIIEKYNIKCFKYGILLEKMIQSKCIL